MTTKKILLVDDEPSLRELIATTLAEQGYLIKSCENAQDALNTLNGNYFDLILTDIRMPGMSGFEFIRMITENSNCPSIVMMSGYDEGRINEALDCGACDIIGKPFNSTYLINKVQESLQSPITLWTRPYTSNKKFLVFEKNITQFSLNTVDGFDQVQVGRGGFFIPCEEKTLDNGVETIIQIYSKGNEPFLKGGIFRFLGKVRWNRQSVEDCRLPGFGVEILRLDSLNCANNFNQYVLSKRIAPFIPIGITFNTKLLEEIKNINNDP